MIKNTSNVFAEDDFILVEAENLSLDDKFMQWEPRNKLERDTKELIKEAIEKKVKNFYRPKYDPSFADDGENICFVKGTPPAVGKSFDWWVEATKKYNPKRNSRLGTRLEYGAYMGVLIKKFVESGKSVKWAWNTVCVNSKKYGHYWKRIKVNNKYELTSLELTGSKGIFDFCDVLNTHKILADDVESGVFWVTYFYPNGRIFGYHLSEIARAFEDMDSKRYVGWMVCS